MIGYLKGEVLDNTDGKLLVLTGGVGYLVSIPQRPAYSGLVAAAPVELFIYTHVREEALDLYGFVTRSEKELFTTLLAVSGIGPKSAAGLLSQVEPGSLVQAILEKDKDFLTRVPGIGKKTAERIVLELSDPLRKKLDAGVFSDFRSISRTAGKTEKGSKPFTGNTLLSDATAALVSLGYRENDIGPLLGRVLSDSASAPQKVEDLIRAALRQLN